MIVRSAGLLLAADATVARASTIEMTRPQTPNEKYHWIYFFGTHGTPAGRGLDRQLPNQSTIPFALIAAGMEAKKKRAAFLARASTLYSFLFEDIALIERELGPTD